MNTTSQPLSSVVRYEEELLSLIGSHCSRLTELLVSYESLKVRALLGIAGIATIVVLASAGMLFVRADLLISSSKIDSGPFLFAFFGGGLTGFISAALLVYYQFRQRWIVLLQIRVTSSALDQIVTHATRISRSGRSKRYATSGILWAVMIAEARTVLQQAHRVSPLTQFDEELWSDARLSTPPVAGPAAQNA